MGSAGVPKYPLHLKTDVSLDSWKKDALHVLQHVKPDWDSCLVCFKEFNAGITNKVVGMYLPERKDDMVLLRIYGKGTESFIDRDAEKDNITLLHEAGCAPSYYASFKNGLAYAYVPGLTTDVHTVRSPEVMPMICDMLAKIHCISLPYNGMPQSCLWKRFNVLLDLYPDSFKEPERQEIFLREVAPKGKLVAEMEDLQSKLGSSTSPIVFCHNDLLLGNIIYSKKSSSVTFIDYEYGGLNYQAFDIGNHFCEYAGVEDVDYSRYPDRDLQLKWLRLYLMAFKNYSGQDEKFAEEEVESLYVQVNQFSLAANLFWGIWAIIQAHHSLLDFDFLRWLLVEALIFVRKKCYFFQYGILRMNEYFQRKEMFLKLQPKDPITYS
ncbi:unnamed protein product [Darwinula stevensoni]|uniref:ethanolamine kinase n=1 Tax=Darwinula stevensoni TaxID=69355 RepID=A0A7R9ACX3_9CRUS|nr:unnamed protein product [Darwinula stevensoni]CAG0900583.1 unnamed protein product [Darwinula stevensoni]